MKLDIYTNNMRDVDAMSRAKGIDGVHPAFIDIEIRVMDIHQATTTKSGLAIVTGRLATAIIMDGTALSQKLGHLHPIFSDGDSGFDFEEYAKLDSVGPNYDSVASSSELSKFFARIAEDLVGGERQRLLYDYNLAEDCPSEVSDAVRSGLKSIKTQEIDNNRPGTGFYL